MRNGQAGSRAWVGVAISLGLAASLGRFTAFAVVDAKSQANTNAPADGAPWDSVGGTVTGASGVYVGAGWVLTAAHVGGSDIYFGSTRYYYDGTTVRLTNADGTVTDMDMFHLKTLPPLPRMPLTATTPAATSTVDFIGFGYIAGSAQTTLVGSNNYTGTGFYYSSNTFKSWGNNKVSTLGLQVINVGLGDLTTFVTTFDQTGQTSDEAQLAPGDSGGGVFQKTGPTWQLVGMMDAISAPTNQPASTAAYGNDSFLADIATYRPQIVALISNTVPKLSINRAGTNVLVCWPDSGATYGLYVNHNLSTTNWSLLSPTLTLTNGQYCATLPATNGPNFFRLRKP